MAMTPFCLVNNLKFIAAYFLGQTQLLVISQQRASSQKTVFADKNGEYLKYSAVQGTFNKAFKALNLPWRSTHICRHTNATLMLLATNDLSCVQANLGHSSRNTTEVYAKALVALNKSNAEKTANLIDFANKSQ
jgi:site-specific recombinase XerC